MKWTKIRLYWLGANESVGESKMGRFVFSAKDVKRLGEIDVVGWNLETAVKAGQMKGRLHLIGRMDEATQSFTVASLVAHRDLATTNYDLQLIRAVDQSVVAMDDRAEQLLELAARLLPEGDRWLEEWKAELSCLPPGERRELARELLAGAASMAMTLYRGKLRPAR